MLAIFLLLPAAAGLLFWVVRKSYPASLLCALLMSAANLLCAIGVYKAGGMTVSLPVSVVGFTLTFRADGISSLFLLFSAAMVPLLLLYTVGFCKGKSWGGLYLLYLSLSISMINGALLSDDLGLMLFFWEGLLCTLFGMLLLRNREKPRAAIKALTVSGTADLILMLGIAATIHTAGTSLMSGMSLLPVTGVGALGCACLLVGALGKAGCMPFHSWIPLAAEDAPTPFLAAFPGSLEKIVGIYLASRIVTQLYDFKAGSLISIIVVAFGAATVLFAGAMALAQNDMKRLLAYSAISQVGYMAMGIGTGLAVGVAGGVFHLLNHVLYKTGLFMAAGAVELAAGTTDLRKIGGLRGKMPVTAACTIIFGLAIAGFPGMNGFYSKELIFDAALQENIVFYLAALAGAVITATYFLKLAHAVFFGKPAAPGKVQREKAVLFIPEIVLAAGCIIFAVWERTVVDGLVGKAFSFAESFGGFPKSALLVAVSCVALALALADHLYGYRKSGSAAHAADHIVAAPGARQIYALADRGTFDLYGWITGAVGGFSKVCRAVEDGVTWLYDVGIPKTVLGAGDVLSEFDNGRLSRYLALAIAGMLAVGLIFILLL